MTGSSGGGLGLAGRDEIGSKPGTVKAEGVNSIGVDCGGVVINRCFEVDQLHLSLPLWPVDGQNSWGRATG